MDNLFQRRKSMTMTQRNTMFVIIVQMITTTVFIVHVVTRMINKSETVNNGDGIMHRKQLGIMYLTGDRRDQK